MQLVVSESVSFIDPMGVVTLTVERSTGFVGEVVVYWEVEDDGLDDIEPAGGNLTFADVSYCSSLSMCHNNMHDRATAQLILHFVSVVVSPSLSLSLSMSRV